VTAVGATVVLYALGRTDEERAAEWAERA
jgi:hypothetical protein